MHTSHVKLQELVGRYDDRLRTADYDDVDASANGLQVGPDDADVERVAFAVDAVEATAEAAIVADADVLVAHHGLSWGGIERITGRAYGRIAPLIRNDIALYVSHLPLDGHPELGNAAGVADLLELTDREPFAELGGEPIGVLGRASGPLSVAEVADRLGTLDQGDRTTQVFDFGPDTVGTVAVVTGSGADFLDEAIDAGADTLVTGEGKQQVYHEAREAGVNVFLAGHYATETFGVRSLMGLADEWGLETAFVDHPTSL